MAAKKSRVAFNVDNPANHQDIKVLVDNIKASRTPSSGFKLPFDTEVYLVIYEVAKEPALTSQIDQLLSSLDTSCYTEVRLKTRGQLAAFLKSYSATDCKVMYVD